MAGQVIQTWRYGAFSKLWPLLGSLLYPFHLGHPKGTIFGELTLISAKSFCRRVVSYRHIRSIHSESTSMPLPALQSPAASRANSRDEGLERVQMCADRFKIHALRVLASSIGLSGRTGRRSLAHDIQVCTCRIPRAECVRGRRGDATRLGLHAPSPALSFVPLPELRLSGVADQRRPWFRKPGQGPLDAAGIAKIGKARWP